MSEDLPTTPVVRLHIDLEDVTTPGGPGQHITVRGDDGRAYLSGTWYTADSGRRLVVDTPTAGGSSGLTAEQQRLRLDAFDRATLAWRGRERDVGRLIGDAERILRFVTGMPDPVDGDDTDVQPGT